MGERCSFFCNSKYPEAVKTSLQFQYHSIISVLLLPSHVRNGSVDDNGGDIRQTVETRLAKQ
jgi:hypothetical protein